MNPSPRSGRKNRFMLCGISYARFAGCRVLAKPSLLLDCHPEAARGSFATERNEGSRFCRWKPRFLATESRSEWQPVRDLAGTGTRHLAGPRCRL